MFEFEIIKDTIDHLWEERTEVGIDAYYNYWFESENGTKVTFEIHQSCDTPHGIKMINSNHNVYMLPIDSAEWKNSANYNWWYNIATEISRKHVDNMLHDISNSQQQFLQD